MTAMEPRGERHGTLMSGEPSPATHIAVPTGGWRDGDRIVRLHDHEMRVWTRHLGWWIGGPKDTIKSDEQVLDFLTDGRTFAVHTPAAEPLTGPAGDIPVEVRPTRPEVLVDLPLDALLAGWKNAAGDGWHAEFCRIEARYPDPIYTLTESIKKTGITHPIHLGHDDRVIDGHHRICAASRLALKTVPVRMPGAETAPILPSRAIEQSVTHALLHTRWTKAAVKHSWEFRETLIETLTILLGYEIQRQQSRPADASPHPHPSTATGAPE